MLSLLASAWVSLAASVPGAFPNGERHVPGGYAQALADLDWDSVYSDIETALTDSQDWWPADYGHYGGLFIRLAWHCAGSYRAFDGRGGCDGARQRFDPEQSWADNTNLDKARRLLEPIKIKYGQGLSWGDLIVLAGTISIKHMGGPVLGFCGGRIDDADGYESRLLGPNAEQELFAPCPENGNCKNPLGASTMQLIYVNPEGVNADHKPENAGPRIRDVFGRMSMNDTETVALIAGGHAFGKCHGACPKGAGPSPMQQPENSWPGLCGTGKGMDAFTSGLEGPWTETPTKWSNLFLQHLRDFQFEIRDSPGGAKYFKRSDGDIPQAPAAHGEGTEDVMMLTTDVALVNDTTYKAIVLDYVNNMPALEKAFAASWYKLMSRDMGPVSRCAGPHVPPVQAFQQPLPTPPKNPANPNQVRRDLRNLLQSNPQSGAALVKLGKACWDSFRATDYQGGCNGARIRFSPQKDYPENVGTEQALQLLQPIKNSYGASLTWADLITLAGNTALETAGSPALAFCPGRTDAAKDDVSPKTSPRPILLEPVNQDSFFFFNEYNERRALSPEEAVALHGGIHGAIGPNQKVSKTYFTNLLTAGAGNLTIEERIIRSDPRLRSIVDQFAGDNALFLSEFASAWVRRTNIDRFDGPLGNACDNVSDNSNDNTNDGDNGKDSTGKESSSGKGKSGKTSGKSKGKGGRRL
eukprot:gb/GEZN01002816.1/.p1 GENE.gb/GEZN01002816.1/~~gb/GEZN01002816.1/.p1  ORF type:complete len:696 (+),score=86.45 gb/GEZN01002816.1/:77-2164(+)